MRVLDENWKKAEDEVYRLDELVENIKQVSEGRAFFWPLAVVYRLDELVENIKQVSEGCGFFWPLAVVYRLDELVENIKQVSEGVVSSGHLLLYTD